MMGGESGDHNSVTNILVEHEANVMLVPKASIYMSSMSLHQMVVCEGRPLLLLAEGLLHGPATIRSSFSMEGGASGRRGQQRTCWSSHQHGPSEGATVSIPRKHTKAGSEPLATRCMKSSLAVVAASGEESISKGDFMNDSPTFTFVLLTRRVCKATAEICGELFVCVARERCCPCNGFFFLRFHNSFWV